MSAPLRGPRPIPPTPLKIIGTQPTGGGGRPESVRLMLTMFSLATGLELLALVLNLITTLADPAPLLAAAREAAAGTDIADPFIELSAWGSVAVVTLFYLFVVGVLVGAVIALHRNGRWADGALRLWTVFAVYFALRGLTVFLISPVGSAAPIALFLGEGTTQILVGVTAVLGAIYGARPETRDWITTPEDRT